MNKERSIILDAPHIRVALDKGEVRVSWPIKPQPPILHPSNHFSSYGGGPEWVIMDNYGEIRRDIQGEMKNDCYWSCPHGKPGDRRWVKETWRDAETKNGHECYAYRADHMYRCGKPMPVDVERVTTQGWKASTCMPRCASRILLEVVSVRVERVQDISEEDAIAEGVRMGGCPGHDCPDACMCPEGSAGHACDGRCLAKARFRRAWDAKHAKCGFNFDSNPWIGITHLKDISDDMD